MADERIQQVNSSVGVVLTSLALVVRRRRRRLQFNVFQHVEIAQQ